jgi:hypothetical protein
MLMDSGSTLMVMSFPNLDELSFLTVLALPKASRMGSHWRILSSRLWSGRSF